MEEKSNRLEGEVMDREPMPEVGGEVIRQLPTIQPFIGPESSDLTLTSDL